MASYKTKRIFFLYFSAIQNIVEFKVSNFDVNTLAKCCVEGNQKEHIISLCNENTNHIFCIKEKKMEICSLYFK